MHMHRGNRPAVRVCMRAEGGKWGEGGERVSGERGTGTEEG